MSLTMKRMIIPYVKEGYEISLDDTFFEFVPSYSSSTAIVWILEQFKCKHPMALYIFEVLAAGGIYEF